MFVNGMYNFVLLYVFANFAFLLEIFKKITDFDGTNEFRTDYVI